MKELKLKNTQESRQERMAVLAIANTAHLAELWSSLGIDPQFSMLLPPETGIVGLRGRIGGGGDPFNFGEATITRASVKLESGQVGHAYALGRDHTKAKLSAILDALAEDEEWAHRVNDQIITPLQRAIDARDQKRASEAAATKVDFFTMVRGED